MLYCWVVPKNEWSNTQKSLMYLCPVKNYYQYKQIKFGTLVEIDAGYIVKAKKKYFGWVVKRKKNLTLIQNLTLFEKLYKRNMKNIKEGKNEISLRE